MKVTFGAVEKPPAKPFAPLECVYKNTQRDRVLMLLERSRGSTCTWTVIVVEPGYQQSDRGTVYRDYAVHSLEWTIFDQTELIVRR